MKNGLLIWNAVLTIVVGYLLFTKFSAKKPDIVVDKVSAGDSVVVNKNFRIAYFEMDSVEANFEMVKDKKAELGRKENEINSELEKMDKTLQQKWYDYRNQAQAGTLNPQQQEAANQELKEMDNRMRIRKQELEQSYQELAQRINKEMKNAIETFMLEYNKVKGYTYIFANEPGLFYYRDTSYNITADVVKGLNISYRKKGK